MCLINMVFSTKFQESSSGKRYKFVVTGHGKYEKVSADSDCSEDANCQPGKTIIHSAGKQANMEECFWAVIMLEIFKCLHIYYHH